MNHQITATLTAPFHHGAGTAGNTSVLRTQEITLPDGTTARVPFLSGNSIRNRLRVAIAEHACRILEVPDGSLSKAVVDLLWSGGAITRSGAEVDLALARDAAALFPALRLFGYSAGSDMVASTLRVDLMHLVCSENAWRLPPQLANHPHAAKGAAAFRDEEFGTRHDAAGSPAVRFLDLAGQTLDPSTGTTQMIYDAQVLKPGAVLVGAVHTTAGAGATQRDALAVAIDEFAPVIDGHRRATLGAKNAVGFGTALIDIDITRIADADARWRYEAHLASYRDEVLAVWQRLIEG